MKIAVISDSHDNLSNIEKVCSWLEDNGVEELIHCGDICRLETLDQIDRLFSGKIFFVLGNADKGHLDIKKLVAEQSTKIKRFEEIGELTRQGKRIAFCHLSSLAKSLAQTQKYDLVFYGHTHKPWEVKINNCRLVNPGNLCGFPYKASFAVYDSKLDQLKLKIVEEL